MIFIFLDPETYNRNQNNFKNYYWSEPKHWPLMQKHSNQTQMVSIFGRKKTKTKKKMLIHKYLSKKNTFSRKQLNRIFFDAVILFGLIHSLYCCLCVLIELSLSLLVETHKLKFFIYLISSDIWMVFVCMCKFSGYSFSKQ